VKVDFVISPQDADVSYIELTPDGTDRNGLGYRTVHLISQEGHTVNLDLDQDDRLIGIELMGFRYYAPSSLP
jgi:hypothetical protein